MINKKNKNYLAKILNMYCDNIEPLYIDTCSDEIQGNLVDLFDTLDCKIKENYSVANGATKCAIVFNNLDCVLKLPFHGTISFDENVDDEPYFEYFEGVDGDNNWDYCLAERDRFNLAQNCNVDLLFAQTRLIKRGTTPIYIQELCVPVLWDCDTNKLVSQENRIISFKYQTQLKNMDLECLQDDWLAHAISVYGQEYMDNFIYNFLSDHPKILDDMHRGNYGYRATDGTPVIFDYSGYYA